MPGINDDMYLTSVHVEGDHGATWHGVMVLGETKGDMCLSATCQAKRQHWVGPHV
jgi:hypothetical protein